METLSRALRDAADDAPTTLDVSAEEWVSTSWRSGRRRRAVRGVAAGAGLAAAAALVVSLVVSGVGGMPSASVPADGSSRSSREAVTSYPQRIGHQWWVRDLPTAPGPIAAVVQTYSEDDDAPATWEVVTASGTRYRLPGGRYSGDAVPVVSHDGSRVAWLAEDGLRVQDLVTGTVRSFPQMGNGNLKVGSETEFLDGRQYGLQAQSPGFFSPSGRSLAVLAVWNAPPGGGVLVLGEDGAVIEVPGMHQPAGWLDDDRLLGRSLTAESAAASETGFSNSADLVVWSRGSGRTEPLGRVEVPSTDPGRRAELRGQWWGSVRSDGTLWLDADVSTDGVDGVNGAGPAQRLAGYSLPGLRRVGLDGRPTDAVRPVVLEGERDVATYQRQWRGRSPLLGTDGDVSAIVAAGQPAAPLVVVDPSADVTQVIWAQDAIDGSPSWSPFGTSTFWLSWWWKEIALAALAVAVLRWWLVRRRGRGRQSAGPAS